MPNYALLKTLTREVITRERALRVPEPDLIMDDPDKAEAFRQAGQLHGVLSSVYLFHTAQISEVLKPGDVVVDLGCGPCTQLAMVAEMNPECRFIGVDLSLEMLDRAKAYIEKKNISNIELKHADISSLEFLEPESVDAVMSTVVLHHLPDFACLDRVFSEVNRVLKPGGGLYLVDFARLKSEKSMQFFASKDAHQQPELYTLDYLYSLRAAFSLGEFRELQNKHLATKGNLYKTFIMPFMVAIKSDSRSPLNDQVSTALKEFRQGMTADQKNDLTDLKTFFRMGGLRSPLLD